MITVEQYSHQQENIWDNFILTLSFNGTFLHTRKFLEYHPKERFRDNSLIFWDKEKIIAVLPAHIYEDKNKICLASHNGSTYGGLVFNSKYYKANRVQEVINALEEYIQDNSISFINLKITPSIFSAKKPDLLEYMLTLNGYKNYGELSTYVELESLHEDILLSFEETKRKIIRRLERKDISIKRLFSDDEVKEFYDILTLNLSKFNVAPIHSYEDLLDFKNNRIPNNVEFYGVYLNDKICSAGMMFVFDDLKIAHAQNLSTDPNSEDAITITYLYYAMIKEYKERGFAYLSWGKSTEECGKVLNFNLIRNKEAYGSNYDINYTFYKFFEEKKNANCSIDTNT